MSERDERDGPQTIAIHAGKEHNPTSSVAPPIWQTSTHRAPTTEALAARAAAVAPADFYTRYGNPNHKQVEAAIAALEGGEAAILTASGMGAIFTTAMALLSKGDHAVAQTAHYGGALELWKTHAPRFGVDVTLVDQTKPEAFDAAMNDRTKLVYVETPTNPLMGITDLRAVAKIAKARRVPLVCDNTFATPINQRPLELGADLVVHSATKYLGGHSDLIAGAIVGSRELVERVWRFSLVAGATLGPFDSWLLLRGIRTLGLRVAAHNANALALARWLERHPKIGRVHYPGLASHAQHALAASQMKGFTGMMSFELKGGFEAASKLATSLRLASFAPSLGGTETLVVHQAAMWNMNEEDRRRTGISDALLRLSVGIEDEADLIRDFEQALAKVP